MKIVLPPDPPSDRQRDLLLKLTLSSEFSEDEADATRAWLDSDRANRATCRVLIDRALNRIQERDNKKRASEARRQRHREGVR